MRFIGFSISQFTFEKFDSAQVYYFMGSHKVNEGAEADLVSNFCRPKPKSQVIFFILNCRY